MLVYRVWKRSCFMNLSGFGRVQHGAMALDWRKKSGLSRLEREREREIKSAFDALNVEGTGIGYHELKAAMRALMLPVKKADVLEALRACGHSPQDVLDFKEFAKIIRNKFAEQDPLAAMLTTFRLFDTSGAGRLSLRDVRRAVKETNLPIAENELERMISFFDQNGSGTVGEAEFVQVMVATDLL
ncbi:Centrin-3 [Durusdinium trenchii]|uniref:Centrin-3 n=1 Tax=Durusdinium trenchii TaxID=1381693 RepID=A0ABP0KN69_9DINO